MILPILRRLRRRFLDMPRGFGHPVPAAAFDEEYRSGHWQLLDSPDEETRYATLASLVRAQHPRPRLLDAGCGSGRLAIRFKPGELAAYLGVDLSAEAIRIARDSVPPDAVLQQVDLETWTPTDRYEVIVMNEVIGYFHDPARTLRRLAPALAPGGVFVVSLYRWGNAPAIWRRLGDSFATGQAVTITNAGGDKVWDIRILLPVTARPAPSP